MFRVPHVEAEFLLGLLFVILQCNISISQCDAILSSFLGHVKRSFAVGRSLPSTFELNAGRGTRPHGRFTPGKNLVTLLTLMGETRD
jgi:hypothetical protein